MAEAVEGAISTGCDADFEVTSLGVVSLMICSMVRFSGIPSVTCFGGGSTRIFLESADCFAVVAMIAALGSGAMASGVESAMRGASPAEELGCGATSFKTISDFAAVSVSLTASLCSVVIAAIGAGSAFAP